MGRNREEQIIDRMLLTYLLRADRERRVYRGITGIQKLSFLSELKMLKKRAKGMNYTFFRLDYGPMSKQIYSDWDSLQAKGWLQKGRFELTKKGLSILDEFLETHHDRNKGILGYIDTVVKQFGHYNTAALKDHIYEIQLIPVGISTAVNIKRKKMRIRDIPRGMNIITKLEEGEADLSFDIDENWLESLELGFILTPETEREARITTRMTTEELFESV